jgi:hypothetical protein
MKILNLLVILFLLFSIFLIYRAVSTSAQIDKKQTNSDSPIKCYGDKCKFECGMTDPKTIKECDPKNPICSSCKCDASGKLSGCMECKESDPNDPSKKIEISVISSDQCTDPFIWDDVNKTCILKPGHFCMPPHVSNIDCNPYTGRKLLTLDTNTNTYKWSCVCKDNTMFSGDTCTNINVCGMEGSIDNPDNENTKRGFRRRNTTDQYWNKNSRWDPMAPNNGECKCNTNEVADNQRLLCLRNGCFPGTIDESDNQSCNCSNFAGTLVDCNLVSLTYDDNGLAYYNGSCARPSCVPDPCGGPYGKNGKYVKVTDENGKTIGGKCQCNEAEGYYLTPDPDSYTGYTCEKLCENNGPCGNRGKCHIHTDLTQSFSSFNIRCANNVGGVCQSPYNFYIIYKDAGIEYYLNYLDDTKELKFEKTQRSPPFNFKIKKCQDTECKTPKIEQVQKGLISDNSYYMMIGMQYVSFKNQKYDLVGEDRKEESLFKFHSMDGDKMPQSNASGNIYIVILNQYLSTNSSSGVPVIIYKQRNDKPVYCGDYDNSTGEYICNAGYRQDSNLLCSDICYKPGENTPLYRFPNTIYQKGGDGDEADYSLINSCCSKKGKMNIVGPYGTDLSQYKYYYVSCS